MPSVVIDVTRLLYRRMTGRVVTGIDRASVEYVRYFGAGARALLTWSSFSAALSRADSARMFDLLLRPGADVVAAGRTLIAKACTLGWLPAGLRGSFLFNTGHYGLDHRLYASMPRLFGARPIVLLHDLIPITHPQYCRRGERERHVARMRNTLRFSHGIVVNSHDTLALVRRFAEQERLAVPPVVIPPYAPGLPVAGSAAATAPRPLAAPYFVMLGTIEPRKNHLLLLRVWRRLIERCGAAAPRLVVIGQRGWDYDEIVRELGHPALQGIVLERGPRPDAELLAYLHHAQALLMPSHVEGYGLPVVEALALGVPVIASNLAVFREIAADLPEYASPSDEARWMTLIEEYARPDSAARKAQLSRLAGFRPGTWGEHFSAVESFLESLG